MKPNKEITFLDSAETRKKVRKYFYISLCVLLIVDFFIPKHGHFPWKPPLNSLRFMDLLAVSG